MRMFMFLSGPNICAFALIFLLLSSSSSAIRSFPNSNDDMDKDADLLEFKFIEAPEYQNGVECSVPSTDTIVHIAMTLDSEYLRGSIAAIHSVLKHASCPDNIYFHFIASSEFKSLSLNPTDLTRIIKSTFPALGFEVYPFDGDIVRRFISPSIRKALDDPLNYARIYLADILDINRVIYLDSDIIVVDDIQKLWSTPLTGSKAIGAPEYCHVDLKSYFSDEFWSDQVLRKVLEDNNKRACYFNTGVMVMDLGRWREGNYRRRIEKYMEKQRERRIYKLGSLPPFLLVFGGDIEAVDHRWNQHGLGGDNVANSCRSLHPGPVSLLHWSGKGKPWFRLDQGRPCPVDYLWEPYDLHRKTLAL